MKKSNPKSLENLKRGNRFVKGQSGNPAGRPKKLPDLDKLLIEILSEEKDGKTALEVMLLAMRKKVMSGDTKAFESLIDRAYGKVATKIDAQLNVKKVREVFKIGDQEIEFS
jgi:hypothetical protein